jgi:hypothetical protein
MPCCALKGQAERVATLFNFSSHCLVYGAVHADVCLSRDWLAQLCVAWAGNSVDRIGRERCSMLQPTARCCSQRLWFQTRRGG